MSNFIKESNLRKLIFISGLLGAAVIAICSLITAIVYRGSKGESYSVLNHFISELGQVGVSRLAPVFNTGLVVGGFFFLLFVIGLGLYFRTKLGFFAAAVGIFAAISCSLVGFFPMNHIAAHIKVASSFFNSGLIMVLLFTIAIVFDKQNRLSKWLVIPGCFPIVSFALFITDLKINPMKEMILDPSKIVRPNIWLVTILEWLVFFTVIGWILIISIYIIKKEASSKSSQTTR